MLFIHRPQDQQAASTMRQRWWPKEFTSTADIILTGVAGKAPHNLNRRLAMTDNSVDSNQATDKCRLADKITGRKFPLNPEDFAAISSEEICQIVSDVLVHQVELEIQNEQLLRTQQAKTATRAQYFDLYNLAPVGYCTFNELGEIVEANIAATELLNMGRAELIGQPITRYIHFEDQEIFYHHHTQLLETGDGQTCQLRLMRRGQPPFWARLDATVALGENGGLAGRLVISDISSQKKVEAVMAARLRLKKMATTQGLTRLLLATVDEAEALTDSSIGFYHLIASDNGTDMLQSWSTNTIDTIHKVEGRQYPCPSIDTSLWRECLQKRRPVLHNEPADLSAESHRLVSGHPEIIRQLVVPVIRGDTLVAVIGVGNKIEPYSEQDVEVVVTLANLLWDLAEQKLSEEKFRRSEEKRHQAQDAANARFREEAESLYAIYHVVDRVGLIIFELEESDARIKIFNAGAEKLFGYRKEEAIGQSIALICPKDLLTKIRRWVAKLSKGKVQQSINMAVIGKSGERFPALVSIHPFDFREDRFRKAVGIFRDISELVNIQKHLEAINVDLERRVEQRTWELQEAQQKYLHAEKLSVIGKLSASIAHEFNNPLQGILSILKGLQKRAILEEEDRELLAAAIAEGNRIKSLILSLQDFNRPSPGRKMPMDIHICLDAMLLLHRSDFKNKRITVKHDYADTLPEILAVPDQIKQVFLNLLTNAADACQQPGGVITVATRHEGDRVAVSIRDSGVGIKPEKMDMIFQPFYTTKPEAKGTGLGLPVCYGIVKEHGGEIEVQSQPGEGTICTVWLPLSGPNIKVREAGR